MLTLSFRRSLDPIVIAIVLVGKPLRPRLRPNVFPHQTHVLLDDFLYDVATVVVREGAPPTTKVAPPPIGLNQPSQGIVSIHIAEVVPDRPANQFPLFEEQPARIVAKGNPPDHPIVLVVEHLAGRTVACIENRHYDDSIDRQMQHGLTGYASSLSLVGIKWSRITRFCLCPISGVLHRFENTLALLGRTQHDAI